MILLIDNYDSFTYNLAHLFGELGAEVVVRRNDAIDPDEAERLAPSHLVLSPGPGRPAAAGVSVELVRRLGGRIPTLGVCLGLQCAAIAFGARVVRAPEPRHGKTSLVTHDGTGIFAGVAQPTEATRYHSLMVDPDSLPAELVITARADDGVVMGLRHRTLPLDAVQFHPESVLTTDGMRILENFCGRT